MFKKQQSSTVADVDDLEDLDSPPPPPKPTFGKFGAAPRSHPAAAGETATSGGDSPSAGQHNRSRRASKAASSRRGSFGGMVCESEAGDDDDMDYDDEFEDDEEPVRNTGSADATSDINGVSTTASSVAIGGAHRHTTMRFQGAGAFAAPPTNGGGNTSSGWYRPAGQQGGVTTTDLLDDEVIDDDVGNGDDDDEDDDDDYSSTDTEDESSCSATTSLDLDSVDSEADLMRQKRKKKKVFEPTLIAVKSTGGATGGGKQTTFNVWLYKKEAKRTFLGVGAEGSGVPFIAKRYPLYDAENFPKGLTEDGARRVRARVSTVVKMGAHRHCLQHCGTVSSDGYLYVVTRYAAGGSLRNYLSLLRQRQRRSAHKVAKSLSSGGSSNMSLYTTLSERNIAIIVRQLVAAVAQVHRNGIPHGAVDAANVLFDADSDGAGTGGLTILLSGFVEGVTKSASSSSTMGGTDSRRLKSKNAFEDTSGSLQSEGSNSNITPRGKAAGHSSLLGAFGQHSPMNQQQQQSQHKRYGLDAGNAVEDSGVFAMAIGGSSATLSTLDSDIVGIGDVAYELATGSKPTDELRAGEDHVALEEFSSSMSKQAFAFLRLCWTSTMVSQNPLGSNDGGGGGGIAGLQGSGQEVSIKDLMNHRFVTTAPNSSQSNEILEMEEHAATRRRNTAIECIKQKSVAQRVLAEQAASAPGALGRQNRTLKNHPNMYSTSHDDGSGGYGSDSSHHNGSPTTMMTMQASPTGNINTTNRSVLLSKVTADSVISSAMKHRGANVQGGGGYSSSDDEAFHRPHRNGNHPHPNSSRLHNNNANNQQQAHLTPRPVAHRKFGAQQKNQQQSTLNQMQVM